MRPFTFNPGPRLISGDGAASRLAEVMPQGPCLFVTDRDVLRLGLTDSCRVELEASGREIILFDEVEADPSKETLLAAVDHGRRHDVSYVIGFGGGSPMDVAKLVAALLAAKQDIRETFGIGKLTGRSTYLACIPTTAGTGSEVSPNAVILDETESLKKAVISPHLVPDGAYVDPMLTLSVPPAVTAATGMDALTHCIEAYANRFAHPIVDVYALEGIRQIARHLATAVEHGNNVAARTAVALGSLYGGMCLGPVNTAAVHALAYPLGSEFHVAHGVSNAVLLPHVLEFNLPAAPQRYADIAMAMGVERATDDVTTGQRGLDQIQVLSRRCGIPAHMESLGVPTDAVERMARSAMTVTRLLERNVREVTLQNAIDIYRRAM